MPIGRILGLSLSVGAGVLLYHSALPFALQTGWAVTAKARGNAATCSWSRVLGFYPALARFDTIHGRVREGLRVEAHDTALDIDRVSGSRRAFWISQRGATRGGRDLLAYLLAEHAWIAEKHASDLVRRGDVVLDCGAHVGVFTSEALELGASRVVAIEPHPVNAECLRRNFAPEIAAGRVVVVQKGVWSREATLPLFVGVENSGMGTVVHPHAGAKIDVPLTTIDHLVGALGLSRVDYIKMDIEGAEREALAGAQDTLRRFRPRLMLDTYHEQDDAEVLPRIIRQAHPDYAMVCGPCEPKDERRELLVPHVTFYR